MASGGSASRIRGLDGLRAIAIILVILLHTFLKTGMKQRALGRPLWPFVLFGWTGVDLFFALSGFLITRLILKEEASHEPEPTFSLARFYVRRALRILPPFFFVVLVNFLVFSRFDVFESVQLPRLLDRAPGLEIVAILTFWLNYYIFYFPFLYPGAAFVVYWSLCVEEHFYLVWPLTLKGLRSRGMRLLGGMLACAAMCLARGAAGGGDRAQLLSHYRMDSILWGAVGALAFDWILVHPWARRLALAASGAVTFSLMATLQLKLGDAVGLTTLAIFATSLVVRTAALPGSVFTRALEWRPLRAIGRVSYGMYLLHLQMVDLATRLWRAPVATPAALVAVCGLAGLMTFGVAWAMYRLVETPFLRLKESRFSDVALRGRVAAEAGDAQ